VNAYLYAHKLYQQREFTNTINYFSSYEPRANCVYEVDHEVIGHSDFEYQEQVTSLLSNFFGCNETTYKSYISEVEVGSKGDKE